MDPAGEGPEKNGRPRIFDAHAHAFPDGLAPTAIPRLEAASLWFPARASHDGTVGGLVASMDRAGIERVILCSVATRPQQVPKITDWSAAVASERIVPFASIHPDYAEVESEVERIAAAGLKGIKFHPEYMACPLDDARAVRIARAAAAAGLAMVVHAGYDMAYEKEDLASPARVRRLHETVPDLRLMACHLGGWQRWTEALGEVAGLPIWLETSMTLGRCPPDLVGRIIEKHPKDRLLFGTDAPWSVQKEEVEKFLAMAVPEGLKRRALWDNALAFLGEAGRASPGRGGAAAGTKNLSQ